VNQPQAVLPQQQRVRVQGEDVLGGRHREVRRYVGGGRPEHQPGHGVVLHPAAPHQRDVGVQVHRLVRLMRQRGVPLALEHRDLRLEDPHQPGVQLGESPPVRGVGRPDRGPHRPRRLLQVGREAEEDLIGEEGVRVVPGLLRGGHSLQPGDGVVVLGGERLEFRRGGWGGGLLARGGGDLGGEATGGVQPGSGARVRGVRVVIEQERNPQARELLQRRGPERGPDHPGLLRVGGDEDGHAAAVAADVLVQLRAGNPLVGPQADEGPVPGHQVGQRREQQRRDRERGAEQDRRVPWTRRRTGQVGERGVAQEAEPREHGDDDRETRAGDRPRGRAVVEDPRGRRVRPGSGLRVRWRRLRLRACGLRACDSARGRDIHECPPGTPRRPSRSARAGTGHLY